MEVDGQQCMLEILDTAGTEQFTAMRDLYMKNGQGFILVYSITAQSTFNDLQDLREQILRVKVNINSNQFPLPFSHHPTFVPNSDKWLYVMTLLFLLLLVSRFSYSFFSYLLFKDTDDVPMVLVGNKCDLEDERVVGKELGKQLAQQFNCSFMETSAKAKINVNDVSN